MKNGSSKWVPGFHASYLVISGNSLFRVWRIPATKARMSLSVHPRYTNNLAGTNYRAGHD